MPTLSLYLKGRFYAKFAVLYLTEGFYAAKCGINNPCVHYGKDL